MISLKIDNSYSQITNLTAQQYRQLRDLLSYNIDDRAAYFSGSFYNKKRYLIDKKGNFPTGLLHHVLIWLAKNRLKYTRQEVRRVPRGADYHYRVLNLLNPPEPYPDQINAVEAALCASRGTISMPTGTGKTLTMAILINSLRLKTLIVVPNLELKKQIFEAFRTYFGAFEHFITVKNIDDPSLYEETNYDCLIIDEAHHSAAKTYRQLNRKAWNNIYFRFFFTATPFRSKDEERLLYESICGEVIYRLSYKEAVEKGYIVPVEAHYIEVPNCNLKQVNSWPQFYSKFVVNNEKRNDIIHGLLLKFHAARLPTICLVKEIEHGNILSKLTGFPFVHGEDKSALEKFNKGEIKSIIGTVGVLGEGVDTKPAEIIVIAGLGKSKNSFMQQVGRGVRTYPDKESCHVILFLDKSHKWSRDHFRAQRKYLLEEYGIKPSKLIV